ncbi:MAG: alpha/beta fold hydrolase, partial [Bacteroidota bacterium]
MKNLLILLLFSQKIFSQTAENQYFTSFDGVKIAYFVEGKGKPIMLVPGFRGTKNNWVNTPLKNKLIAENYQVISMDTRGLGFSDKPQKNEDYANDAEVKDL